MTQLIQHAQTHFRGRETTVREAVLAALSTTDAVPNPTRCGWLFAGGTGRAKRLVGDVVQTLQAGEPDAALADAIVREVLGWDVVLTGAETTAAVLAAGGVRQVFAYAGTSELALCDAVDGMDGLRLVNGRGDRECAFMAAGGSVFRPNRAAAILHGARGLTNAAGAVADVHRNEIGTLFVVGLPTTTSAPFLPPHGEPYLMRAIGTFAGWVWEAPPVPSDTPARRRAGIEFVAKLVEALAATARAPRRPALFGIPQDLAELRWIDLAALAGHRPPAPPAPLDRRPVTAAAATVRTASRPFILVDDYALRHDDMRRSLDRIARRTGAAVAQVRYRRGPMLFERIQQHEVTNFIGWFNQYSDVHAGLLADADLLVTVEDRNVYRRVVGELPTCRKIAINSDPAKVLKNGYLSSADILIPGDPALTMAALADQLDQHRTDRPAWFPPVDRLETAVTPQPPTESVGNQRRAVARELIRVMRGWSRPVLVDDSQMFGGLLSDAYDDFPAGLRVVGSHGGFVGSGLAYAVGLAVVEPDLQVMCTLGDQGFTNALQGLVAAAQERARVLFVVCNNGGSVSLQKQTAADFGGPRRRYLGNVDPLRYGAVAAGMGIAASRHVVPIGEGSQRFDEAVRALGQTLHEMAEIDGPRLLELVLPNDPAAWTGIWLTQGFEQQTRPAATKALTVA